MIHLLSVLRQKQVGKYSIKAKRMQTQIVVFHALKTVFQSFLCSSVLA